MFVCVILFVDRKQIIKIYFKYLWSVLKIDYLLGYIEKFIYFVKQDLYRVFDYNVLKLEMYYKRIVKVLFNSKF